VESTCLRKGETRRDLIVHLEAHALCTVVLRVVRPFVNVMSHEAVPCATLTRNNSPVT
jgi:hypothetical protein